MDKQDKEVVQVNRQGKDIDNNSQYLKHLIISKIEENNIKNTSNG